MDFPSCQSLPSSPREAFQHSMEWPPKDVVLLPSPRKALANLGAAKSYPLHHQFCIDKESMQLLSEWMFPSLSRKHLLTYLCLLLTREKGGIGKCMWKTPGWRGQAQGSPVSCVSCRVCISFTSWRSSLGHGWHKFPVVSKWQQEILITTPPCGCAYFT